MSSATAASDGRVVYETHMHTPLCRHADGEPEEYAAVAEARGMKGIIVTCHNPLPNGYSKSVRMTEAEFPQYLAMIERARAAWAGRVEVRLGLECDYVPGLEDYLAVQVKSAPFEYLLASVHPQVGEYKRAYLRDDPAAFHRTYYEHLAMAAETRLFDCISHPDIVKNVIPNEWKIERILPDIQRALDRIAAAGCAMELNTSGVNKEIAEMNPGPTILREMCMRRIPVVVGADAHKPHRVGDGYEEAYRLIERAGYDSVSFFLQRHRIDLPIAQARRSLRPADVLPVNR